MSRNEYLVKLHEALGGFPPQLRSEILHDYDRRFESGLSQGMTEEEMADSLGDPFLIAEKLRPNTTASHVNYSPGQPHFSMARAFFMTLVMLMFNLIVVLGPFLVVFGFLLGFWAAAFGLSVAGIGAVVMAVLSFLSIPSFDIINLGFSFMTIITGSITVLSLGILLGLACWYISKAFFKLTGRYVSWNFKVISGWRI